MKFKNQKKSILFIYALLFIVSVVAIAMISLNYRIDHSKVDSSGGTGSSVNYQSRSSIGQITSGKAESTNYKNISGYIHLSEVIAGIISGKVTQSDGTTDIKGVLIEVLVGGDVISFETTDSIGNYSISLDTGIYDVKASFDGFLSSTTAGVYVYANQISTVNFCLTLDANAYKVSSESHPDKDIEYCDNSPVFSWNAPSSIVGYYYMLDQSSYTVPNASSGTYITKTSLSLSDIDDGTWYFHIVAKDNFGNVGTTAVHYKINIKTIVDINKNNIFCKEDGTKLEIPAGALDSATKVNITVPQTVVSIPYDTTLKEAGIAKKFSLEDGTKKFKKEVTITLTYNQNDVADLDESKLMMFWWDPESDTWSLVKNSKVYPNENKVVGNADHFSIFAIMEFTLPTEALSGLSNYPNPFIANKEQTKIRYILKDDTDVEIEIFDLLGDLVLRNEFSSGDDYARAGPNEFTWDGKDGNDNWVAAGAYICRVKAGNKTEIVKIGVK